MVSYVMLRCCGLNDVTLVEINANEWKLKNFFLVVPISTKFRWKPNGGHVDAISLPLKFCAD